MKDKELTTPKKINMPLQYMRIKSEEEMILDNSVVRKFACKVAESMDNKIMEKVIAIAKEEGYTDLMVINKEFVVEALKREMERRGLL